MQPIASRLTQAEFMTSKSFLTLSVHPEAQFGQKAGPQSGAARAIAGAAARALARSAAWLRTLALPAVACALLGGCSTLTTGYNNAPTLITWWADSYFDLDADQETLLKERLAALRAWHRTQLTDYARVFGEVQLKIQGQVSPADVAWLYDEGEKRLKVLAERAAPQAAELATRLRPENIAALEKKLAKNNAEWEKDYITAPLEDRRDKRYERLLKEAERWYGSFNREQKEKIRAMANALPADYTLVLEDRKRRQAELIAILRAVTDKAIPQDEAARRLSRWMTEYERGRNPAFRDFVVQYRNEAQKMFAAIANMATPEQRQVAISNVQRYRDDFLGLAAN